MDNLLSIAMLGFFIGMRHATDPDHVIAVTTIVTDRRDNWHAAMIGGLWGLGHSLTLLVVGGGIILLNWIIPTRLGLSMELCVGAMLVLLGGWNLAGLASSSPLVPDPLPEAHQHDHTFFARGGRSNGFGIRQLLRPMVVGIVHGLAGSSAVALLILATIKNSRVAIFYLVMFALGTIAGMTLISSAIAIPFSRYGRSRRLNLVIRAAAGIASIVFGAFMVHQIIAASDLLQISP